MGGAITGDLPVLMQNKSGTEAKKINQSGTSLCYLDFTHFRMCSQQG